MTIVINFLGGPSAGKTLMSALTFAEIKSLHKYTVEQVPEYAKQLIWQNRLEELNNQYQVSTKQYKMIKAIDGKVDFICVDSSLLLGLYYNRTFPDNVCDVTKTDKMIHEKLNEFKNVFIYLERNEEFPFETQGRVHDEKESRIIDQDLLELLKEFNIEYLKVPSCKSSIPMIVKYILNKTKTF